MDFSIQKYRPRANIKKDSNKRLKSLFMCNYSRLYNKDIPGEKRSLGLAPYN